MVVEHRTHAPPAATGDDGLADVQRAALDERRDDRTATGVEVNTGEPEQFGDADGPNNRKVIDPPAFAVTPVRFAVSEKPVTSFPFAGQIQSMSSPSSPRDGDRGALAAGGGGVASGGVGATAGGGAGCASGGVAGLVGSARAICTGSGIAFAISRASSGV